MYIKVDGVVQRDVLRQRISDMLDAGWEGELRRRWPPDVPPLSRDGHSNDQLELVLGAVRAAEADVSAGWHPSDSSPVGTLRRASRAESGVPELPVIDDSLTVDRLTKDALKERFEALSPEQSQKIAAVTGEASEAGFSISISQKPSVRRWSIGRALIVWAESDATYDDLADAVAWVATQPQLAHASSVGGVLGQFSVQQADLLYDTISGSVLLPEQSASRKES